MADIIRCKDCKSFQKWRTPEQAEKFGQEYDCEKEILTCPGPDDYCSKAERKEVNLKDKLIDLANAIESDDSGWWTNKRISSSLRALRNI